MLRLEIWRDKTETIRRSRLEYLEIWRDKTEAIQRSRLEYLECVSAAGILGVPSLTPAADSGQGIGAVRTKPGSFKEDGDRLTVL